MAGRAPGSFDEHCQKYSILNNHPEHHIVLSDVLNTTQFCEAFFHVPEVLCEWQFKTKIQCLDKENCRVYDKEREKPERSQPKHVVSFVVLKRGENVTYKAIYENCQLSDEETKHAEEFFKEDAEGGKLKGKLDRLEKKKAELCMYITVQPCHKSAEKSCTETLIQLYEEKLKPLGIEFIVKPTFIYKAYWSRTKKPKDNEKIQSAKEGLKMLYEKGIQVEAMKKNDWIFLKNHLCTSLHVKNLFAGRSYEDSERKKLDDFIEQFLTRLKASAIAPKAKVKAKVPKTTCICENKCAQIDDEVCPCETAGNHCTQDCKCAANKCQNTQKQPSPPARPV